MHKGRGESKNKSEENISTRLHLITWLCWEKIRKYETNFKMNNIWKVK